MRLKLRFFYLDDRAISDYRPHERNFIGVSIKVTTYSENCRPYTNPYQVCRASLEGTETTVKDAAPGMICYNQG